MTGRSSASDEWGGCALILLALIGWLGWVGWPASGCCIALAVGYWGFARLKNMIAPLESDSLPLWRPTLAGAFGTASKAALWSALGCAFIWVVQLVLVVFVSAPDPTAMGEFELSLGDATNMVRAATKPAVVAAAIGIALLVAFACGAVWPITLSSQLKKWFGRAVAIATAATAFTFVGAAAAGPRYDQASDILRARIFDNMKELAKARQSGAALHWLATLADQEASRFAHDPVKWRGNFEEPLALCNRDESVFQRAYRESGGYSPFNRTTYCDEGLLRRQIAQRRLDIAANANAEALSSDWVPEFHALLVDGPPQDSSADDTTLSLMEVDPTNPPPVTFSLRDNITRIRDLRAIAASVESKLNDAKQARESLVAVANGALEKMFKGMAPEQADALCDYFISPLLEEVEKRRGAEVRSWLRLLPLAHTKVGERLLAEGEKGVQLTPPPPGEDPLSGYRDYLQSQHIPPASSPADLEALAQATAERDKENWRQHLADEEALQERYRRTIEERPVEHGIP